MKGMKDFDNFHRFVVKSILFLFKLEFGQNKFNEII